MLVELCFVDVTVVLFAGCVHSTCSFGIASLFGRRAFASPPKRRPKVVVKSCRPGSKIAQDKSLLHDRTTWTLRLIGPPSNRTRKGNIRKKWNPCSLPRAVRSTECATRSPKTLSCMAATLQDEHSGPTPRRMLQLLHAWPACEK